MSERPVILLGVTGSIAAYKAAELVRLMVLEDYDVHVIMTRSAAEFVTPLTFQTLSRNDASVEMFGPRADWNPAHIDLADRASAFVVAPCTGNTLGKLANGIADDLLSSTLLATNVPVLLAPAMNGKMWMHPATQDNTAKLRGRGVSFAGPIEGDLACGYEGIGKMIEPAEILSALKDILG